jgi:acyl-CoA reductase-like NAD-dependent aldehyde dehydrogenase
VCIAPDYALVHEKKVKQFVEACKKKLNTFFPNKDELSPF